VISSLPRRSENPARAGRSRSLSSAVARPIY
jgi:hypothetical protein